MADLRRFLQRGPQPGAYQGRVTPPDYILHYAPDNASLVIRLALEELGLPYGTRLVDRQRSAQREPSYLALNPNGLIPVLETPQGPLFETAAILLWLADRHGGLAPSPDHVQRGDLLKWLFFLSNTLHPALRRLFYAPHYVGQDATCQRQFRATTQRHIVRHLRVVQTRWARPRPGLLLDFYLAPMLRWLALYPSGEDHSWFALADYPALLDTLHQLEGRASTDAAARAEGLGSHPFTAPRPPMPPEGSPT